MDFIEAVNKKMSLIEYGWVDNDGNKHTGTDQYSEKYMLQMPEQLLKSRLGVCWDQVELQRKLFADVGIRTRSFFIVHYDQDECPTHTFTIFEYDNKTFWYEHAWSAMAGLHHYDTLEGAISDIRDKFIAKELSGNYNPQNLIIYEYDAPKKSLSCPDFYKHCESGRRVQIA